MEKISGNILLNYGLQYDRMQELYVRDAGTEHSCSYTIHAATIKDCSEGWASGARPPLHYTLHILIGSALIILLIFIYEYML